MRASIAALAFALLLPLHASPLTAQAVTGRLLDFETDEPVPGASVILLDAEDDVIRGVLTDSAGGFFIRVPSVGRYRLRAERIGYKAVVSPPFDVLEGDVLDVELRVSTAAVPLAPLTVNVERPPLILTRLERVGFYERRETYGRDGMGFAQFLTREDIERSNPLYVTDIFQAIPSVRVRGRGTGLRSEIRMPGNCVPTIYLDGLRLRLGDIGINEIISASAISAIEIYPGIAGPVEFMEVSGGGGTCGSIVLWTGSS